MVGTFVRAYPHNWEGSQHDSAPSHAADSDMTKPCIHSGMWHVMQAMLRCRRVSAGA